MPCGGSQASLPFYINANTARRCAFVAPVGSEDDKYDILVLIKERGADEFQLRERRDGNVIANSSNVERSSKISQIFISCARQRGGVYFLTRLQAPLFPRPSPRKFENC